MGMTGCVIILQAKFSRFGCLKLFSHRDIIPPILYSFYLLLGLASFAWSTNPQYSALQWLMTFESFVFVYIFLRIVFMVNHYFPEKSIDLVRLFAHAIFPIMVIFLIGSMTAPNVFYRGMRGGEELRLGGWIMNPNELGMLAGIAAATAFIKIQTRPGKVYSVLQMGIAILILLMTSSRSSAIGFAFIMFILILRSPNRRAKIIMMSMGMVAVPLLIMQVVFKADGGVEEVMSMTGRLPFWKALLNEGIVREPFFGFGFMRINYTEYFQGLNTYPAKMTHNTFMQVLMNLGFVGFFIAFWQLVTTFRNFWVNRRAQYSSFFIAVFIPILINSFTEFGIFGEANYGIIFYQFLIFIFVMDMRTKHTRLERLRLNKLKEKLSNYSITPSQNEKMISKEEKI